MSEGPELQLHSEAGGSRDSSSESWMQGPGRETVWLANPDSRDKHSAKVVFVSDDKNYVGGGKSDPHISYFSCLQLLITSPPYSMLGKLEMQSNLLAPGLHFPPGRKSVCSPFFTHRPCLAPFQRRVAAPFPLMDVFAPPPDL